MDTNTASTLPEPGSSPFLPLAKGATIGRYIVLGKLGEGGMGVVYAAYDPELDRKVAIKLLHAGPQRDGSVGRSRLLQEAQAMAKLSHPNVVSVYDVGTREDQVFIAMKQRPEEKPCPHFPLPRKQRGEQSLAAWES